MSLLSSIALIAAAVAAKLKPANPDAEATRKIAELERQLVDAQRAAEAAFDQRDSLLDEVVRWRRLATQWRERYDVAMDNLGREMAARRDRMIEHAVLSGSPPRQARVATLQTQPRDDGFWREVLTAEETMRRQHDLVRAAMGEPFVAESVIDLELRCNCVPSRSQVWAAVTQ
jgi:hypothetical protein